MRAAILVLIVSAAAWAKPKVAVVPLAGDLPGNKLSSEVADALGEDFTVVSFKAIGKVTKKTGELDDDVVAELEKELPAKAIVHGKVVKSGAKKSLQLKISIKGQDAAEVTVKLKGSKLDDDGKAKIHDELQKDLAAADEAEKPKLSRHKEEPEEKPKRREEPEEKPKKRVVAEPDETTKIKKRHKKHDEDEPETKRAVQDVFVDAGMAYGMRQLTYDSTAAIKPPKVSTASASARVEGALFLKVIGATGPLSRFGIGGEYDKAFGLSIKLGMLGAVPIDEGHYSIGARYRIDAGVASVIVLGLDYAERHYIADRSGLTAASQFDAPDTDYQSIQLDVSARTPFTPAITGFATAIAMLPFAAGPIQKSDSYGPANVYGLGLTAGIDVALASAIGLRVAGEAEQITLSFKGTGSMAQGRMVTAATDRQLGIFATLALFY